MKKIIFMLLIVVGCNTKQVHQNGKDFGQKANELVLSENKVGQEYFFKIKLKDQVLEYRIVYLGSIKTSKGRNLKFLNNVIYAGLYEDSKRASAAIDIYDSNDKYIGSYQVGPIWALPNKVEGVNLVFSYNDDHCNQNTVISFLDSIPKQIFIPCTEKGGDLYGFTKKN